MRTVRLDDATEFILDGTHGSPVRVSNGVPVLSAQNVRGGILSAETDRFTSLEEYDSFRSRVHIRPGDVLLTIVGSIGRAAVVNSAPPMVFQRSVAILRPKASTLDSRFLYHAIRTPEFQGQLKAASNQSAQAGVYLGKLKRLTIPLPPLSEQKRVADLLDRVDVLLDRRGETLACHDELYQSMFREMFVGSAASTTWPSLPLSKVVREDTIVTYGIVQAGEEFAGGIPYIRTGDLQDGEIRLEALRRTDPSIAARFERSRVDEGDIVMSIRATVGTTAMVPASLAGANLTQGTARISPGGRVEGRYLLEYLRSESAQRWIQSQVKGATFREITLARLRELEVPIPPMSAQQQFVRRVTALDQVRSASRFHATELDALFATLQARLFRADL